MRQVAIREAVSLLRAMTWVLCVVGALALVCTTVNVTRFAASRDVPLPIAMLLDPMIGTALAGVLYVDARLASWGINPPTWSTALRWGAGCVAALMNSWESLWPDGQIGWPRRADPAAVLLHLTPALLLIGLTETIAAYRRCVTELVEQIDAAGRSARPGTECGSVAGQATPDVADARPIDGGARTNGPDRRSVKASSSAVRQRGDTKRGTAGPGPHRRTPTPGPRSAGRAVTDDDLWLRALTLDATARATTGKPVSVWKLRTELHIGPRHACRIHDRLAADRTPPPAAAT
ncbi:extensin [Streptomyces buecherae]|uniref:extensin n=1 Tax=Streptomyces buecherae TaxID=2763006 RepID=UPI0037A4C45F